MAIISKLEIINDALTQLRLPKIESLSDLSMNSFPYNLINEIFQEAIIFFNFSYNVEYLITDTLLEFRAFNKANLENNKIFGTKILDMHYLRGTTYYYPNRIEPISMKQIWGNLQKTSDVQDWSILKDNIHIAPQPTEKEIYIRHYQVLSFMTTENEQITLLPEKYINVISQYIANCLAKLLGKETKDFYEMFEVQELSATMTNEANNLNFIRALPRNIRF